MYRSLKLFFFLLLVVAGSLLFIDTGKGPIINWANIRLPDLSDISAPDFEFDIGSQTATPNNTTTTIHRWQDSAGNWHYSDSPSDASSSETIEINSDLNIINAINTQAQTQQPTKPREPIEQTDNAPSPLDLLPTPSKVEALLESAKNVENMLQERKAQQDALSQ